MTAIDFTGSRARRTVQTIPAATQAGASTAVASGTALYGYSVTNLHSSQVVFSGVPIWEDPLYPNTFRTGGIVPSSGTLYFPFEGVADSGLKFYTTTGQGSSVRIEVFTE